jgi:phytoene dehydrogenase-like protein
MNQPYDVVIIGGGLAGYVAANYLAKTNLSILIVEKGLKVGGRARTDQIQNHYFNLGPHALYQKGKAKPILEELGVQLKGSSPKQNVTLIENDRKYVAPFSPLGLLTTDYLHWKERKEWLGALLKLSLVKPADVAHLSFQQWVAHTTSAPKIQNLLYILARLSTYCHGPELLNSKIVLTHMKIALGGVLYLDDGWQSIIDQLHQQAIEKEVHIKTHSSVKQITQTDNGTMKLQMNTGDELTANYVISTIGPQELQLTLTEPILPDIFPVQGATLDIALSALPRPQQLFAMGVTKPLYYSVHSPYAKLTNIENSVVLHVFRYFHPDERMNREQLQLEMEQFLEKIQPDWQKYLLAKRFMPHLTVNQRFPLVGEDSIKFQRSKTSIPRLYIAGDWTSSDYILSEAAIASGKEAATAIITNELEWQT